MLPLYSCTAHALERGQWSVTQQCLEQIHHSIVTSRNCKVKVSIFHAEVKLSFSVRFKVFLVRTCIEASGVDMDLTAPVSNHRD
jgi:hypothetical protein